MSRQGIYVETFIRGSLDDLWQKTQTPQLHQRWDLRFSEIEYLPRPDPAQPQQFRYTTRIAFGLRISGAGESLGTRDDPATGATSALKFWSDDPKSLIRKGSGYWKYIAQEGGVRFLTWYDYETRFGALGRLFDWIIFRPLISWATAWSFDRLRLWIEQQIDPGVSLRSSVIYALARIVVGFIWLYHGLLPKLLFLSKDEMALLMNTGLRPDAALMIVRIVGIAEIVLGLATLLGWRWRWPLLVSLGLLGVATVGVIVTSPAYAVAAFNPVTLNLATMALAVIALISDRDLPSARHCQRQPKEANKA
ncbi:MAG TPA: DoxX-like family protein [Aggregatilineales bacterium]|nr:DoxX-like family protein [Aggregatilineales bacterium]